MSVSPHDRGELKKNRLLSHPLIRRSESDPCRKSFLLLRIIIQAVSRREFLLLSAVVIRYQQRMKLDALKQFSRLRNVLVTERTALEKRLGQINDLLGPTSTR